MNGGARHYLDYNATCPVKPEVIDVVCETMRCIGNSSSVHAEGRRARALVEDARETIREFFNAPVNGVIFTSGGTESIHYALNGAVRAGLARRIFVSAIEHAAAPANASLAGVPVETIPATPAGTVDLDWLSARLDRHDEARDGGFIAAIMLANNETGVIQPVAEASAIIHAKGGILFVDAAQGAGKIPVNFVMSGADMMAITAHKFGGPVGVGALLVGPNLALEPQMRGGGHEHNRRAGTHNIPAICGLAKACELARDHEIAAPRLAAMRGRLQQAAADAGAVIWGASAARLPGTLSFSAHGFSSQTQLMAMDIAGIAISSGSACSSGKTKPSHVLSAMGAGDDLASCGVRVSIGWGTTQDDIDAFCTAWPEAYRRVKERAA